MCIAKLLCILQKSFCQLKKVIIKLPSKNKVTFFKETCLQSICVLLKTELKFITIFSGEYNTNIHVNFFSRKRQVNSNPNLAGTKSGSINTGSKG